MTHLINSKPVLVFLDNKHIIIHLSSSNACSYQIMDYSCNHRRFGTRCCTNIVKCELNCVVNISLTVLDHIVHVSSSNLCSRLIMDYSCNHRRFGTRCCTNRVQCELNFFLYSVDSGLGCFCFVSCLKIDCSSHSHSTKLAASMRDRMD